MKHLYKRNKYAIIILVIMMASIAMSFFFQDLVPDLFHRDQVETIIMYVGVWGPFALFGITVVEVIFAPIPGAFLPVVAGAIYGPIGILYVWLGNVVGSAIAFFIGRKFGVRIVKLFAPKFDEQQYSSQINSLWLFYFFPIVPVDILSFAFGLSKVPFKYFLGIMSIGYLVSMTILTLFGDAIIRLITG